MKVLSKIPREIIRKYNIKRRDNMLFIHEPSFISMFIDTSFKVTIHKNVITIKTKMCSIDLSKVTLRTHTTIF